MHYVLSLVFLFSSIFSYASDIPQTFSPPCLSEEFLQLLTEHNQADELCFGQECVNGFVEGACLPWVGIFGLGSFLSCTLNKPNGVLEVVEESMFGGTCASVCLSPFGIVLTLPCGLMGVSINVIKWLILEINAAKNEKEFSYQMNVHLYRWMDLIKQGRMAVRQDLLDYQQRVGLKDGEFPLTAMIRQVVKDERFGKYFDSTAFYQDKLDDMLSRVESENDNWDSLFHRLGQLIKSSELDQQPWNILEDRLIDFRRMAYQAPDLSEAEIKEYLPFAIYFLSLSQKEVFKAINSAAKNSAN